MSLKGFFGFLVTLALALFKPRIALSVYSVIV
jgi:hypothetical protein